MTLKTYLICIGTRPEIIKMAPVYQALKARGNRTLVAHTGQHESIAHALYQFFDMPPDISIDLKRKSSALMHLTSALMDGIEDVMLKLNPDVVLVQGDTTTALVGALAGYYHGKPVAHVEAGLRTREREPFPEEKNREMIGRIAHWHFPPTLQARQNLHDERIAPDQVFQVGNTVIDAALWARTQIAEPSFDLASSQPDNLRQFLLRNSNQRLLLITAHRRENWGQPIRNIAQAVGQIIANHADAVAVWPVHPNPAVRADVQSVMTRLPAHVQERICLTEPLGYPALIDVLARCEFTLTDSGGIQEEASAFAKPVLIARASTERQELVDAGGARLVGTNVAKMIDRSETLLNDAAIYRAMQVTSSPFGDGLSAKRIADILSNA